jgi:hypothetical protein
MWRRRRVHPRWVAVAVLAVAAGACGGGDDRAAPTTEPSTPPSTTVQSTPRFTAPPFTTVPAPEGVETFAAAASHTEGSVVYPQTPPVGGPHSPVWQTCTFYDRPVPSEAAVHSLEHGAIWVTYRPDLPPDQVDVLARLARTRHDMVVSRWDDGLPSPVVVSSWGRQLKLDSATDPRLVQFAQAFSGQAPEPNAPC